MRPDPSITVNNMKANKLRRDFDVTLTVYNTATRQKEPFEPIDPQHVRLYVCGPTVYDYAHIGNARPVVVFDVLVRLLRRLYPKVTYVRNITDIDDKINERARREGVSIGELTEGTAKVYQDDMAALGSLPPDVEPRATAHVRQMIEMTEILIEKGHAYAADGHVLFDVTSMPAYGDFANRSRDEMIAGARVDVAPYKKDPMDFVLWKPSDDETPGWDSPWGRGRPGWAIECSAMGKEYLGVTFDIHGGGVDLVFPHHQNEIAQSQCAHDGEPLAKYWMHNGYLMVEGEKMSKSLGNFYTVHDLLKEFKGRGEALRLTLLSTHYRKPLDFTKAGVERAKHTLDRWYKLVDTVDSSAETIPDAVEEALKDDLNTPQAIAELHRFANEAAGRGGPASLKAKRQLKKGGEALGILSLEAKEWFQEPTIVNVKGLSVGVELGEANAKVDKLVDDRKKARENRDYTRADEIRDDLAAQGIILEDGPDGTTWRRE